jgi:hypothetical protein
LTMNVLEAALRIQGIVSRARSRPSGQARIHSNGEEAQAIALVAKYVIHSLKNVPARDPIWDFK